MNLFLELFKSISFKTAQLLLDDEDMEETFKSLLKNVEITEKFKQKLKINGINKQMLIDNWILDIRKE